MSEHLLTAHLLSSHILLGICLSDPHDTLDHYQSAKAMFWPWKYHHDEGDVPALEDLEPKLEKMGKLVEEERIAWMKEQGYPVDLEDEEDDTDVEVIEIEDIEGVEGMTDQRRDSPWMQLWQSAVRAIRTMGWSGWVLRGIV